MKRYIIIKESHISEEMMGGLSSKVSPVIVTNNEELDTGYRIISTIEEYPAGFRGYRKFTKSELLDQIELIKTGYAPETMDQHCTLNSALASKHTVEGYHLFKRCHGMGVLTLAPGEVGHFDFQLGYEWAKLEGIQLIGQSHGIIADLYIEDDDEGTYTFEQSGTAIPRYILNQFGFEVAVPKDFCEKKSTFDADLFYGMWVVLQIENTSTETQTLWANIELDEVRK